LYLRSFRNKFHHRPFRHSGTVTHTCVNTEGQSDVAILIDLPRECERTKSTYFYDRNAEINISPLD